MTGIYQSTGGEFALPWRFRSRNSRPAGIVWSRTDLLSRTLPILLAKTGASQMERLLAAKSLHPATSWLSHTVSSSSAGPGSLNVTKINYTYIDTSFI